MQGAENRALVREAVLSHAVLRLEAQEINFPPSLPSPKVGAWQCSVELVTCLLHAFLGWTHCVIWVTGGLQTRGGPVWQEEVALGVGGAA